MKKRNLLFFAFSLILLLGVLNAIAGAFYLYWTVDWFDNVTHFLGGLSLGMLSLWIIYDSGFFSKLEPSTKRAVITSVIAVLIIGIGWEVFEYINGLTQSTEEYSLDVMHDLIADVLGAVLAGIIGSWKNFYIKQSI